LKEKLLAAHRGGITTVLIPQENEKDLVDIPDNVTKGLDIKPVRWIDEVLELALESMPEPLEEDEDEVTSDDIQSPQSKEGSDKNETLRH